MVHILITETEYIKIEMKIMHVGNLKSGIDTYVRNTVAIADERFEYVIVNGADDDSKPYMRSGRAVKQYSIAMYRALNPFKDFKAICQTIKIIRKEKPDLVHCHSAKGGVIGRVAAFLTGTKSVYTPHAFSFLSADSAKKSKIFLMLEKIAKLNSKMLACAESEKELGMKTVGFKEKDAYAWNNAISDIKPEDIKIPETLKEDEKFIISIARPSYQKDPLLMVETMKRVNEKHPDVKFYMVGVGYYSPLLDDMKALISKYNLEDVMVLVPWIERNETLGFLQKSLFYITTSRYEGLPIAVLEALALGKAVVSTDVLGNRDCVKDGVNGRLLNADSDAFAASCCELIENDSLREKMGKASRELFESEFFIDKRIGDLERIYLEQIQ